MSPSYISQEKQVVRIKILAIQIHLRYHLTLPLLAIKVPKVYILSLAQALYEAKVNPVHIPVLTF